MKDQTEIPEALALAERLANDVWEAVPLRLSKVVMLSNEALRRLHAESELHLQELRSYRITVENREARIAELEAQLAASQQEVQADVPDIKFDGYQGRHEVRWYINELHRVRIINQWLADVYCNKLREFYTAEYRQNSRDEEQAKIFADNALSDIARQVKELAQSYWLPGADIPNLAQFERTHDEVTKRLLAGLPVAPAHPAEGVQPSDKDLRDKVARALGCGTGTNYAWSYLLKQIESLVECEEDLIALKKSTHSTPQGLDAQTIKHISALSELVRMPNAEHFADAHNAAVRHLRAIATQAKQGEQ